MSDKPSVTNFLLLMSGRKKLCSNDQNALQESPCHLCYEFRSVDQLVASHREADSRTLPPRLISTNLPTPEFATKAALI